jgi:hypothetical protein
MTGTYDSHTNKKKSDEPRDGLIDALYCVGSD